MSARLAILAIVVSCSLLPAQGTAVFPSDHAAQPDGDSLTSWFPYAYGVSRIQVVYEAWDLTVPAGRQITRIGFRQEQNQASFGKQLQLQVLMAPTDKDAANLDYTYAANYFAPPTSVFGPALHVLPDLGNPQSPNPDGNMVWLTLSTPFTPVVGKNLLVEFRVMANNNGGAAFPYYLDVAGFESPIVTGPAGCAHSGNQIPTLLSQETKVGGYWYSGLSQAPANQLAVWLIGFGPLQTPFPLAGLFAGVSPSCHGQLPLNGLLTLAVITDPNGYHGLSVAMPNDRGFNDVIISSQVACLDFFSPGGFVVSNGDQMQLGIDPAMTVLYSTGANATTGSLWASYGVVTHFAWQ